MQSDLSGYVPDSELSLEEARELIRVLRLRQSELEKNVIELQNVAEYKQAIIDSLPASIAVLDINGFVISVNESWRNFGRQNGAKDERFSVGVNYSDVCQVAHPEADSADASAVGLGLRDVMTGKCTEFQYEYPCHSPTEQRWFQAIIHSIAPPFPGFVVCHLNVTGWTREITHRKLAEEALAASERELRLVINSMPGPVSRIDRDLRYTFANDQYEKLFGLRAEDVVGRTMPEVIGQERFERVQPFVQRALAGEKVSFESKIRWMTGEIRTGLTHFLPEVDEQNNVLGFIVVGIDITELRQAEDERNRLEAQLRQAQRLESIGRLAGGVAHDFNNMLGVIIGHTELGLLQLHPDEKVYSNLEQIQKAATRSADLTSQLLAFARKQTVAPRPLDLNLKVSRILSLIARLIGEDISIQWSPGDQLWVVKMDASQIEQILTNLCVNARDAITGVGSIVIETANYTVTEADCVRWIDAEPGDYVRLAVSDTGSGMDSTTISQIFEPFFTTKSEGLGTGLGLATVYGAVRQNNGFVTVRSELDQGSTFSIFLPRHIGIKEEDKNVESITQAPRGHETILVVEDESALLELTCTILQMHGYNVLAAATPAEAHRLAVDNAGKISLLVTDVIMPEMNGRDLADLIQQVCPTVKRLFISGYTDEVIAPSGALEDGTQFLQKPFTPGILASKIREVLDHPAS